MRIRSLVGAAALLVPLALSGSDLQAQQHERFTPERFSALQAEGAWILLDVHADWCPTCALQQEILKDFQERRPDSPIHILQIDFDDQKEYVKRFRAPRQSTLILYQGRAGMVQRRGDEPEGHLRGVGAGDG